MMGGLSVALDRPADEQPTRRAITAAADATVLLIGERSYAAASTGRNPTTLWLWFGFAMRFRSMPIGGSPRSASRRRRVWNNKRQDHDPKRYCARTRPSRAQDAEERSDPPGNSMCACPEDPGCL